MEQETNQFLGKEHIGKLMRKYAIPCIISLLVGALYCRTSFYTYLLTTYFHHIISRIIEKHRINVHNKKRSLARGSFAIDRFKNLRKKGRGSHTPPFLRKYAKHTSNTKTML